MLSLILLWTLVSDLFSKKVHSFQQFHEIKMSLSIIRMLIVYIFANNDVSILNPPIRVSYFLKVNLKDSTSFHPLPNLTKKCTFLNYILDAKIFEKYLGK